MIKSLANMLFKTNKTIVQIGYFFCASMFFYCFTLHNGNSQKR